MRIREIERELAEYRRQNAEKLDLMFKYALEGNHRALQEIEYDGYDWEVVQQRLRDYREAQAEAWDEQEAEAEEEFDPQEAEDSWMRAMEEWNDPASKMWEMA